MIFKKPYAFLIKNFRLIHILLMGVIIYITYDYSKVVTFFSKFTNNSISVVENMASQYINALLFIAIFLTIIFAILMYLLMQNKQKPKTFYITLFIYYVIIFISLIIAYSIINSLFEATATQQASRAYRDLYLILSLPNYYFIVMSLIRGIGFDVKKFNFSKDLEELEIKSNDNEEFEFVLGVDSYKYKRKFRRIIRELKYYAKENKIFISIIISIAVVIILGTIFVNTQFINKKYSIGDTLTAGSFTYKLNSAYVTQYNFNGSIINSSKKYVILNMTITNNGVNASIPSQNIFLTYGNTSAYYKSSVKDQFIDIGQSYTGSTIASGETGTYLFIFEIGSSTDYSKYALKILNTIEYNDDNQPTYSYETFSIKPTNLDKTINDEEKNLNEVMYLGDNIFGNSYITIKDAEFMSSYEYQYDICDDNGENCKSYYNVEKVEDSGSQQLLVITYDLNLDSTALINNSMEAVVKDKYIFDKFLRIKYKYNGVTYTKIVTTRTNSSVENKIFINISNNIANSNFIQLLLYTRYNHFYINLTS